MKQVCTCVLAILLLIGCRTYTKDFASLDKEHTDNWPGLTTSAWSEMSPGELRDLLSRNDIHARGEYGITALMLLTRWNQNTDTVRTLLDAGARVNDRDMIGSTALMWAAGTNENPEVIRLLLEAGADLQARDIYGRTVLMFAADESRNPDVIRVLLDAGAVVNARNVDGMTAWDFMKENEVLVGTEIFWTLRDRRFEPVLE